MAVPLCATKRAHSAGEAVVATFARSIGCTPSKHDFDVYVAEALDGGAVLAIHSEGDPAFDAIGCGFPEGYVDVRIGHWKELTGEDD